ncbi:MAG: esterase-like activity of phytase family protein, partial [Variovorax sp.]
MAPVGCDSPRSAAVTGGQQRLRLLGEARWSHRQTVDGTPAGGLSAMDYDAAKGEYLLLSDDRSDLAPVRFYSARWPAPGEGTSPNPGAVVFLQQPAGGAWPSRAQAVDGLPIPDPEALRLRPDTGTVLWTTEGDVARGFGPALYESARDGRWLREFALPAMFSADPAQRRGPRDNLGFEGLALTPDGRRAWLAMENALIQDGAVPSIDATGGPCRFTQVDLASGVTLRQIAYQPDAIPLRPRIPGTYADNGVSEVLMLDAHRMLVLERAYAAGTGNSLRLYEIDTRGAADVLAIDALTPYNHRPVT